MSTPESPAELAEIRAKLLAAESVTGLWETAVPQQTVPPGMTAGEDSHLAYLTLVYAISGGREPGSLWTAARALAETNSKLFDPTHLAYSKPANLLPPLQDAGVIRKKSEATVWQRIGQAIVMRGQGSVKAILAAHEYDAEKLLAMLQTNKTTFPMLSGPQMAPRWLWGLAREGQQPLTGAAQLPVPVSPAAKQALTNLEIEANAVSAEIFDVLDKLGRIGCVQQRGKMFCPVVTQCPVSPHCQFGS